MKVSALTAPAITGIEETFATSIRLSRTCGNSTRSSVAYLKDGFRPREYNLLTKERVDAYIISMGESLVNTFALRQQFEWAFENAQPKGELWHGYRAEHFGYDEQIRQNTLEISKSTRLSRNRSEGASIPMSPSNLSGPPFLEPSMWIPERLTRNGSRTIDRVISKR
jgi:hypothetical protein